MARVERGMINDSLYTLYSPPHSTPDVDIIFFHGLQRVDDHTPAYRNTWSSDGGETLWPQTLLGEAFPRSRIFSVSYDSAVNRSGTRGRGEIFLIAENLVADIIESGVVTSRDQKPLGQLPIVLVGHSLGGLVIKKFLLMTCEMKCDLDENERHEKEKIDKLNQFIGNLRGIFYYSPPHHGTKLADVASKIPEEGRSEVLIFLKTLSKETGRLNHRFGRWRKKNKIRDYTIGENLATSFRIFGVQDNASEKIVPEGSARHDTDDFYTVPHDHINVCKPNGKNDNRFKLLHKFIQTNVPTATQNASWGRS